MTSPTSAADQAQQAYERTARRLRNKTAADSIRKAASLKRTAAKSKKAPRASRNAGRSNKVWSLLAKKHKGAVLGHHYASKKGELVATNMLCADSKEGSKEEWELECRKHPGVRPERLIVHVSLSRPKGADLNNNQWAEVVQSFLREAGAEGVTHVAYRHSDTAQDHIHLIFSRSLPSGRLLSESNDFYTMRDAAQRTSQRLGIEVEGAPSTTQAPTDAAVRAQRRAQRRGTPNAWVQPEVVQHAVSQARTLDELSALLQARDIELKLSTSNSGQVTAGVLMRAKGSQEWLAGSSINRNFSLPAIQRQIELNAQRANGVTPQRPPTPIPNMRPAPPHIQVPRQRGG